MGARELRKKIRTLDERIREHEMKILVERARPAPDRGPVRHWQTEIRAFRDGIRRARKRLGERR